MIGEYDGNNTLLHRYVHGPATDEPLVSYDSSGARHWLLADERGSVIAITDDAGNVEQVEKYDAFGAPDAANQGRFQYTGQMWLGEVGLYHYKARAYHPALGRFMQTDPIGVAGGLNLYGYTDNDPVNLTDPSGLCWIWFPWCGDERPPPCGPKCEDAVLWERDVQALYQSARDQGALVSQPPIGYGASVGGGGGSVTPTPNWSPSDWEGRKQDILAHEAGAICSPGYRSTCSYIDSSFTVIFEDAHGRMGIGLRPIRAARPAA